MTKYEPIALLNDLLHCALHYANNPTEENLGVLQTYQQHVRDYSLKYFKDGDAEVAVCKTMVNVTTVITHYPTLLKNALRYDNEEFVPTENDAAKIVATITGLQILAILFPNETINKLIIDLQDRYLEKL